MDEQFVHEDQMRNARTQGVGSMVSEQNRQNALELMRKMHKIDTQNAAAKARIESNLDKALQCVDNVRDFVGSPEHILGNPKTKHGEIAENVDVWFHNADQIMHNRKADATFERVGRTVATDYMIKTDTYAINGPGFCLSDTSREKGTISNCTFVRVSNCIREMGVVQNCVFENCSNVVNNCGYMVRENLFNGCKQACVDLQKKAIVSNCRFANCTGFNLITSTTNSEVKIEDCEFSNISTGKINSIEDLNNFGAQEYFNGNAPHDLQMLGIKGSVIEFGAADKKFANANHPNKIVRCIFNNIHICPTQSYYYNHGSWKVLGTENQSNFMISVKIFEYEKFDYPRAVVSDCSFTNCFAASDSLINEYFDFKPVFSKNRYYRLIRQENNYGLNNMRNPSDFVESNNVKLKETNASGKKIGSSMPVEWDDSEYTTCKMATTWLNTFNKA